jgi:Dyp-type peroxidase family
MALKERIALSDLAEIQGLIISGYGHLRHGCYLFIEFGDAPRARQWIGGISGQVASGAAWPRDAGGRPIKPESVINLAFTYTGLTALTGDAKRLSRFPLEFVQGMTEPKRAERVLGDVGPSAPEYWDIGGSQPAGKSPASWHAVVILLTDTPERRETMAAELLADFAAHNIELLARQDANVLPGEREHFGFLDGTSQPHLEGSSRPRQKGDPIIKVGDFLLGYTTEYEKDQQPIMPSLDDDQHFGQNGTYLVFRKIAQDVAGFWNFMADFAANDSSPLTAGMTTQQKMIWLASKFVGRWPNGTPLTKHPDSEQEMTREDKNYFLYHQRDPHGEKAPLGSHIRRSNPRDSLDPTPEKSNEMSRRHMIIRRGMPYGPALFAPDALPAGRIEPDNIERGLMFFCINANINRQFEFIQQTWANNPKFHSLYDDLDPLIGSSHNPDVLANNTFTIQASPIRKRIKGIPQFTIVRGGAYFFMPSIPALRMLADLK